MDLFFLDSTCLGKVTGSKKEEEVVVEEVVVWVVWTNLGGAIRSGYIDVAGGLGTGAQDGGEGDEGGAVMCVGGGTCVNSGWVSGRDSAGSLGLPDNFGKTYQTVSNSFSTPMTSLCSTWKDKGSGGGDFVGWDEED